MDQDPRVEAARLGSGATAAQRAVGSTALDTSGRLAARCAAQGRLRAGERRRASGAGRRQSAACGGRIAEVAVDGAPGPVRVRKTPGRERIAWGRRWRGRNGEEAAGACPSAAGCGHDAPASNCRGTGAGERGETRPGASSPRCGAPVVVCRRGEASMKEINGGRALVVAVALRRL